MNNAHFRARVVAQQRHDLVMIKVLKLSACAAISFVMACAPSRADLIGTQVTGSLTFSGGVNNYFDPAQGFVPGADLNSAGATVTVSATDTEFGFQDGSNTDTADFTGSQLIVEDSQHGIGSYAFEMTFTDPAFANIAKVSDTFNDGGISGVMNGDVITLTWAGNAANEGELEAVFDLNAADPANAPDATAACGLLGLSFLAMAIVKRFGRATNS